MNNSFEQLGISEPILKAIKEMGFEVPTEVQSSAIPHVLKGEDLIVMSKTGSGKTAVFGIPMLQMTEPTEAGPQSLILTPTRELAVQVDNDLKQMAKHLSHKTTAVYGQHNINTEIQALKRGVSIVTGTPGRVYDHIQHGTLTVKNIRFLVLDEADRMLDMGFIDQVRRIVKALPTQRVTLLFSATMPNEIINISRTYMKNPTTIEIESPTKTVDSIQQAYYRVEHQEKCTQLTRLLLAERPESCMIFCNTRMAVDRVVRFLLRKGYAAQALHGDIPQAKRMKTIQQFKQGEFHLLVATDVAARGIHIEGLSLVINYDVPNEKDSYVHRIGRTGRAGNDGRAMTMVTSDDIMSLYDIEEHIGAMIPEGELPTEEELTACREESQKWAQEQAPKTPVNPSASETKKPYQKNGQRGAQNKPYQKGNGQDGQGKPYRKDHAQAGEEKKPYQKHNGQRQNKPYHKEYQSDRNNDKPNQQPQNKSYQSQNGQGQSDKSSAKPNYQRNNGYQGGQNRGYERTHNQPPQSKPISAPQQSAPIQEEKPAKQPLLKRILNFFGK